MNRNPKFFAPLLLLAFLAGMFAGIQYPLYQPAGLNHALKPMMIAFNALMGGLAFSMAFSLACFIAHALSIRKTRKTPLPRLPDELREAMRKGGNAHEA